MSDCADLEYQSCGTLDLKLLEVMVNVLETAKERARMLRETINHERLEVAKTGERFRGRQVARLFTQSFRAFDNSEMMFDLTHLAKMECDPNNLHSLLVNWRHILDNQTGASYIKQHTEILRDPFYNKIKGCPELARDITDYERMRSDDPRRTYEFLYESLVNAVHRQQTARNMADREAMVTKGQTLLPSAPATANDGFTLVERRSTSRARRKKEREASAPATERDSSAPALPGPAGKGKGGREGGGKGKGQGGKSRSRGPRPPVGACYEFWNTGSCSRGAACTYKHEARPAATTDQHCYFFHHEGPCKYGDGCKYKHVTLSAAEKAKLVRPTSSRAASPAAQKPGPYRPAASFPIR